MRCRRSEALCVCAYHIPLGSGFFIGACSDLTSVGSASVWSVCLAFGSAASLLAAAAAAVVVVASGLQLLLSLTRFTINLRHTLVRHQPPRTIPNHRMQHRRSTAFINIIIICRSTAQRAFAPYTNTHISAPHGKRRSSANPRIAFAPPSPPNYYYQTFIIYLLGLSASSVCGTAGHRQRRIYFTMFVCV